MLIQAESEVLRLPGPEPNTVWFEEWDGRYYAVFQPYLGREMSRTGASGQLQFCAGTCAATGFAVGVAKTFPNGAGPMRAIAAKDAESGRHE